MIINNYKIVEDNYKTGIVWGYIHHNSGEIKLYSPLLSKKIEKSLLEGKKFINIELLNSVIYFEKQSFFQKTNNILTSVFREKIDNKLNYNLIEKKVYLDKKTNKLGLYKKKEHVGILVNLSIENINDYKNIINNIILKHTTNSRINGAKLSNIIKIIHNNTIDLSLVENLDDIFLKNRIKTKNICDGFIELIKSVDKNQYENEDITLYIVTNSINMNNINIMYDKLMETGKINTKWKIINIETDEMYLNDLEQINI
tara:strand:- start:2236 stop:3006 length:771 start_codon:yes stop_codon:yes gene_type:complete